jgi:phage-related tail fiber protein
MSGSIGSNSNGDLELYSGSTKVLTAGAATGVANFEKTPTAPTPTAGVSNSQFVTTAVPAGLISFFTMAAAPIGWLKANGAAISRTTYAGLFAAIGTNFGAGDGSTTFNLPDLRGEFLRAWDDGRTVDNGRGFGTWQDSGNRWHNHGGSTGGISNNHQHYTGLNSILNSGSDFGSDGAEVARNGPGSQQWTGDPNQNHSHGINGDGLAEARPRNIALLACIKY